MRRISHRAMLGLVTALLRGAVLDRHAIARRCHVQLAAADRMLRLLARGLPGMRLRKEGRALVLSRS